MLGYAEHRINERNGMDKSEKAMSQGELTHRMLEVFAAVMSQAGISAAARSLDISQPSVSRHVAELEQATKLKLFIKRGRTVVPTKHAIALFERVQRSFIGLQDIALHAQQLRQNQENGLSVGCLPALGYAGMAVAIAALRVDMPQTTVRLEIDHSLAIGQMVASMRIDLGFVAAGVYPVGVEKIGRISGNCQCILPPGHALQQKGAIALSKLVEYPFIALSSSSRIRQELEGLLRKTNSELRVVAETKQSVSASDLVLGGVGISVVDPFTAAEHVRRGGAAVNLRPAIEYDMEIIAHSDARLNAAARSLLSHLRTKVILDGVSGTLKMT